MQCLATWCWDALLLAPSFRFRQALCHWVSVPIPLLMQQASGDCSQDNLLLLCQVEVLFCWFFFLFLSPSCNRHSHSHCVLDFWCSHSGTVVLFCGHMHSVELLVFPGTMARPLPCLHHCQKHSILWCHLSVEHTLGVQREESMRGFEPPVSLEL